ncbi:MAG: polysaccharide biosynthesis protein, partial [Eubacteriales bacterium]
MTHPKRTILFMLFDIIMINIAVFGSFYLRFEGELPPEYPVTYMNTAVISTIVFLVAFSFFGIYRHIWRYASIGELLSVV